MKKFVIISLIALLAILAFLYLDTTKSTLPKFHGKHGLVFSKGTLKKQFYIDSYCKIIDDFGNIVKMLSGSYCTPYDHKSYLSAINGELSRVSMEGKILWRLEKHKIHHSLDIASNGDIYALSYELRKYRGEKVLFDTIIVVSPNGELKRSWSSFARLEANRKHLNDFTHRLDLKKYVKRRVPFRTRYKFENGPPDDDYHHMNSVFILKKNYHSNKTKVFRKGNILVSFNRHNFIAILDSKSLDIVWTAYPYRITNQKLHNIHTARMTKSGNITVFLNGLNHENESLSGSQLLEFNPLTMQSIWTYPKQPSLNFFSKKYGSLVKLDSGHYLATDYGEQKIGRAFKVSSTGSVNWVWFVPQNKRREQRILYMYPYEEQTIRPLLQE